MRSPTLRNPVIDAILSRRSVRGGFDGRPVEVELLEAIVACGLAAPSSKNAQPWRFHVVQDRRLLAAVADAASATVGADQWIPNDPRTGKPHVHWPSSVQESAEALRDATVGIVIENRGVFSGGRRVLAEAAPAAYASSLLGYAFEVMGVGAALENMWLAANSLGLSAAFLGDLAIAETEARSIFSIDGDMIGVLALGYSSLVPGARRGSPEETQSDSPVVWH